MAIAAAATDLLREATLSEPLPCRNEGNHTMEKKNTSRRTAATTMTKREKNTQKTEAPPLVISDEELYERVARKAYELYQQRGEEWGHEIEDWLTAERLVKAELLHGPAPEEPLAVEEQ